MQHHRDQRDAILLQKKKKYIYIVLICSGMAKQKWCSHQVISLESKINPCSYNFLFLTLLLIPLFLFIYGVDLNNIERGPRECMIIENMMQISCFFSCFYWHGIHFCLMKLQTQLNSLLFKLYSSKNCSKMSNCAEAEIVLSTKNNKKFYKQYYCTTEWADKRWYRLFLVLVCVYNIRKLAACNIRRCLTREGAEKMWDF